MTMFDRAGHQGANSASHRSVRGSRCSRLERLSAGLLPPENLSDVGDLPPSAACSRDTAGVEGPGDAAEAGHAGRLAHTEKVLDIIRRAIPD